MADKGKKRVPSDALQSKIFTRWVHQKVYPTRGIEVKDLSKDCVDGTLLLNLMEVLSERACTKKVKPTKMKPQQIDAISVALEFTWQCGVHMQLKPSAEQINAGDLKSILALVYAIMLKYMKVGDEEEAMNARDALIMWSAQQCAPYGIAVDNLTVSWEDGRALCALIHKNRPKLIGDFDSLKANKAEANIELAMSAAERYFKLERYLTPAEYLTLDEKCMVVYISEYFYGIAEQRKLDLAAKSIGKVIKFTEENDAMKQEYETKVASFKKTLDSVKAVLNDRTVDNTLEGAQAKIAQFYSYKTTEKTELVATQLSLESLYNHISMRLAQNNRPAYVPLGFTLTDVDREMKALEETEKERKVALQAELARQLRLVNLNQQLSKQVSKLTVWFEAKKTFLITKEEITSVSAAQLALRKLDTYDKEAASQRAEVYEGRIKKLVHELDIERFSKISEVKSTEADLGTKLGELAKLSEAKRPVLEDDLTREQFKEKTLLQVKALEDVNTRLSAWISEKKEFLAKEKKVECISDATAHLAILAAFETEKERSSASNLAAEKNLVSAIIAAKHESKYSMWVYEKPQELTQMESDREADFIELGRLAELKKIRLNEQLKTEVAKEGLRLDFAFIAGEAERFSVDVVETAAATTFGFSLDEVTSFSTILSSEDAKVNARSLEISAEAERLDHEMTTAGVQDNAYTDATVASIREKLGQADKALKERKARYDAELARLVEDDRLCKEFADTAEPFTKTLFTNKEVVSTSTVALEDQLVLVNTLIEKKGEYHGPLAKIEQLEQQMTSRGIESNPHTSLSAKDCKVQDEQYELFLETKSKSIQEAIQAAKMRGITKEQLAEMEAMFAKFDADGSGVLDKKELKTCMYTLGEEATKAKVELLMKEYGDGEKMTLEGFKGVMIPIFGVTVTHQDIIHAFQTINKQGEVAKKEDMEMVLADHDYAYFTSTCPDGNYKTWTEKIFAR